MHYIMLCFFLVAASAIQGLSYDYSATIECLAEPLNPQYGGGIITNPEFNSGLKGWSTFGHEHIEIRKSKQGNNFLVAHTRNASHHSFSQKFYLQKGNLYTFSAWAQVSKGKETVSALVKTSHGYETLSTVVAQSGCWSMLKGGLTANSSGPAEIYFESKNTSVDIWIDSISLQPFTSEEWRSHQEESLEKIHKQKVRIHATDSQGKILAGAKISINQRKPGFPVGAAITKDILTNTAYQNWFLSRFTVTVFENEMKWYFTETSPGREDYSVPDAMLKFVQQHNILVRGHNIFWDDPIYQPQWILSLSPTQLRQAVEKRINSVVSRYAGQLIAWDVVNENLHFSYFEDKLGDKTFSPSMYRKVRQLDCKATMFMNDYNTIEDNRDKLSAPSKYIQKLKEIQSTCGQQQGFAIGLEAHFKQPNIAYVRSAIDTLAATGLPIWITELDVESWQNQAQYLEEIMREVRTHPAVKGMILWVAMSSSGQCYRMCLTDTSFKNLPTGDVVDKLITEWSHQRLVGITDENGFFDALLFNGDYEMTLTHPNTNSTLTKSFNVDSESETALRFQILE
ncbi:endo-1,4-beta-xylanase [Ranunculus cassubicifolius]